MLPDGTSHSTTLMRNSQHGQSERSRRSGHHIGYLDEAPALQLLQAGADLAARHRKGVGDLLGAQRATRVQQDLDLRYGGAYAPARSQFAPVQDDFSVTAERFMSKTSMIVIGTFATCLLH